MKYLIALVLIVSIAGCSDSDMEENFGLACYFDFMQPYNSDNSDFFEFDFDKNTVFHKRSPSFLFSPFDRELSIINISPTIIVFGGSWKGKEIEFTFDRATMTIERKLINKDGTYQTGAYDSNWGFICESSQL